MLSSVIIQLLGGDI